MIAIVDFGMGNLASLANSFSYLGIESTVVDAPASIEQHTRLVLPGVGSFAKASQNLREAGWIDAIRGHCEKGRPLLGICLGMQLLFDTGEEHGLHRGIGLLRGNVAPLPQDLGLRIPHVGWSCLEHRQAHPLFKGVKTHVDFYFVHSFECIAATSSDVLATCDYGKLVVAAVAHENVAGVQFHPEKSQDPGLKILGNFAEWMR